MAFQGAAIRAKGASVTGTEEQQPEERGKIQESRVASSVI